MLNFFFDKQILYSLTSECSFVYLVQNSRCPARPFAPYLQFLVNTPLHSLLVSVAEKTALSIESVAQRN